MLVYSNFVLTFCHFSCYPISFLYFFGEQEKPPTIERNFRHAEGAAAYRYTDFHI